ncbi:hypothetical protein [Legionella feeleii]|uniref:hypothetical protein n=1 Tax=Legionella feeleii TaxID=453 RepID=UPI000E0FEBDF|nr:hypothetical protein [Legionella feeleii]
MSELCGALKERLPELCKNASLLLLKRTFESLSTEQRAVLFEATKNSLPEIVVTIQDLMVTIDFLASEQRASLLESIKNKLPRMINSASDLPAILNFLSLEECRVLLDSIKDGFPKIFRWAWYLEGAFHHSSPPISWRYYSMP